VFLGGRPGFGFGTPTSVLYRADLVRATKDFYPSSLPHSDASACFRCLQSVDFGFVFQVLSYGRIHDELESAKSVAINRFSSAYLHDLIEYGPLYLSKTEFKRRLKKTLGDYDLFLAKQVGQRRGKAFWDFHRRRLSELGHPIRPSRVLKAAAIQALREILNPQQALKRSLRHIAPARKRPSKPDGIAPLEAQGPIKSRSKAHAQHQ
jgi:hypothetical protein